MYLNFILQKDEAFNIWIERWGHLYEPNSQSRQILENVANSYLLVNLVDNDYVKENCIFELLDEMVKMKLNSS
jgi:methylenetetrahydrofolate reductase (NADPH)